MALRGEVKLKSRYSKDRWTSWTLRACFARLRATDTKLDVYTEVNNSTPKAERTLDRPVESSVEGYRCRGLVGSH